MWRIALAFVILLTACAEGWGRGKRQNTRSTPSKASTVISQREQRHRRTLRYTCF